MDETDLTSLLELGIPMEPIDWDHQIILDIGTPIDSLPILEEMIHQNAEFPLSQKEAYKTSQLNKDQNIDKKRKKRKRDEQFHGNFQVECCVEGCHNVVRNRLRFHFRVLDNFKEDFIAMGWNKVCQYHYFADLYRHKKVKKVKQGKYITSKKNH